MTEGNGHVIDPNGDARRALQEAVAEHGPEVLSDAGVMENVCRDHLAGLPGESILIGDAAQTNVSALLSGLIPQLGNYGAIQSAAATLAGEHSLDMAASLWVVREFARALGYIAPATGTAAAFPGSGPRPVPGSGPPSGAGSAERPLGTGGVTGAAGGSGTTGRGSEESENVRPGGGEAGRAVAGGAAAGGAAAGGAAAAAGVAADEAGRGESAGSEAATSASGTRGPETSEPGTKGPGASGPGTSGPGASGAVDSEAAGVSGAGASGTGASGVSGVSGVSATGAGGQPGAGGETIPRGVAASRAGQAGGDGSVASGSEPGYGTGPASGGPGTTGTADGGTGAAGPVAGGPGTTGPVGGIGPVSTGPMRDVPRASGPVAEGAWGGPSAPGGATGGAAPEGEPGFPLPLPAARLPGRQPQRSNLLNRNTVGIAAAIALIAGYLGVAAVAHLSPFPAKAVSTASASQSSSPPASTSSSPASSPDPSADPSPRSQGDILLTKIPSAVGSAGECLNDGTSFGATAVIQCQKLQGLGANTIRYYLYPSKTALAGGFSSFLKAATFIKRGECTTSGSFRDFIVNCESDFTIKKPGMTGSIAEYVNKSANQEPVIVSIDNEQDVMAVLVGTNDGDLLAYWNQLKWVVTP